jgi:hypothetical protein
MAASGIHPSAGSIVARVSYEGEQKAILITGHRVEYEDDLPMLNARVLATIRKAERAVIGLVDRYQMGLSLYAKNPKATAQVSRTGKWLLNAIKGLYAALESPSTSPNPPSC